MIARHDIAVVMVTVDRSPARNYLGETLENVLRSNILMSKLAPIFLSASDSGAHARAVVDEAGLKHHVCVGGSRDGGRPCANLNVADALRAGAGMGGDWVLFLEDDLDVCGGFFDSVGAWLDDHADLLVPFYPLGAAYPQVEQAVEGGCSSWLYPIGKFYGTQAVVMRAEVAAELADYLVAHCYDRKPDGTAYDLLMVDWARSRGCEYLLTPAPSFVQHIGGESTIRPRAHPHSFDSWRGRGWSYLGERPSAPSAWDHDEPVAPEQRQVTA